MSEKCVSEKGVPLILDICKALGADRFPVQSSARAYYDPVDFAAAGIELISFSKPPFVYPQLWGILLPTFRYSTCCFPAVPGRGISSG